MEIIFLRHGQSTENMAVDNNLHYDENNIVLTERGELQCIETGKYLKKIYNKFDLIIQSPVKRCTQTASLVNDQIKCTKKIITDKRLTEMGNKDKLIGLPQEKRGSYLKSNTKYYSLIEKIQKEENPFKFTKLMYKANIMGTKLIGSDPDWTTHYENIKSFLNDLKKYEGEHKRILVISHGGTMKAIESIITNIPRDSNIKIMSRLQTVLVKEPVSIIETNNCIIMCVLYEDNCYKMVSPANNLHLLDFSKS